MHRREAIPFRTAPRCISLKTLLVVAAVFDLLDQGADVASDRLGGQEADPLRF
jgi:hypothetical protein